MEEEEHGRDMLPAAALNIISKKGKKGMKLISALKQ